MLILLLLVLLALLAWYSSESRKQNEKAKEDALINRLTLLEMGAGKTLSEIGRIDRALSLITQKVDFHIRTSAAEKAKKENEVTTPEVKVSMISPSSISPSSISSSSIPSSSETVNEKTTAKAVTDNREQESFTSHRTQGHTPARRPRVQQLALHAIQKSTETTHTESIHADRTAIASMVKEAVSVIEAEKPGNEAPVETESRVTETSVDTSPSIIIPTPSPIFVKAETTEAAETNTAVETAIETEIAATETAAAPETSISQTDLTTDEAPVKLEHYSIEPTRAEKKAYTEKASKIEMEFAGTWLNFTGILFLIIGIIFYLTTTLKDTHYGIAQTISGISLGLLLVFIGHYLYQKNMQKFAHPLIAGGFCITFFTLCASYFHYHIINQWMLFFTIFITIAWSGISIFKYDSKLIGNGMLVAAFLAPFFMQFSFSNVWIISFYLIAINLGVAYVAYYKKWDYYLTVAFLATYILYFYQFHFTHPVHALVFLVAIYLLYLISNNVVHFVRKSSSGYQIFLSYLNPVIFAVTSYFLLLKMANLMATIVYVGLGVIHLLLTWKAAKMEEQDSTFSEIVRNNLVLGVLFLTASVSFITYFSNYTACFSIVAALWFLEAFALLLYSFRWKGCETILRRYSYLSLLLASAQLAFVIPTMDANIFMLKLSAAARIAIPVSSIIKFLVYLISSAAYFKYFLILYKERAALGSEEKGVMIIALLASYTTLIYHIYSFSPVPLCLEIGLGTVAFLTLYLSRGLFKDYSRTFRWLSFSSLILNFLYLCLTVPSAKNLFSISSPFITCIAGALLYFLYFLSLYGTKDTLDAEENHAASFSLLTSFIITVWAAFQIPLLYSVAMAVLALAALQISFTRFREYAQYFKWFSYGLMALASYCFFMQLSLPGEALAGSVRITAAAAWILVYSLFFLSLYLRADRLAKEDLFAMKACLYGLYAQILYGLNLCVNDNTALTAILAALSFISLVMSYRDQAGCSQSLRRLSFISLLLFAHQIIAALPVFQGASLIIPSKSFFVLMVSAAAFFIYFLLLYRDRLNTGREEEAYMGISYLATMGTASYIVLGNPNIESMAYIEAAGTVISASLLVLGLRFKEVMKGYHNFGFIGLVAVTGAVLFTGSFEKVAFLNVGFGAALFISALFIVCAAVLKQNEDSLGHDEKWTVKAVPAMTLMIVMKSILLQSTGSLTTFLWSFIALMVLYCATSGTRKESLITLSQVLFFIAFLKSILFDANFAFANGTFQLSAQGTLPLIEYLAIMAIVATFGVAAKRVWNEYELRNLLVALALFIFSFQCTFILYRFFGLLDYFQVILSTIWSIMALIFITLGITRELKIYRQFGLILMVASILKVLFVDTWVLNISYNVTTFVIIGVILILNSFLYQKNRAIIAEKTQVKKLALDPA
ncbi:MAG: DUF2339 domain-containing protein [Vulcanimicrobiota bacterium]